MTSRPEGVPRTRKGSVYVRRGKFILERNDTTVDGIPIGTGDITILDETVSPATLGAELVSILARAVSDVRRVESHEWDARLRPLLDAAEVRSWSSFVRGARNVSVFEDDGYVRVSPTVNRGEVGGFDGSPTQDCFAPVTDLEAVGLAVTRCLLEAQ